jgi:hypothetical protein
MLKVSSGDGEWTAVQVSRALARLSGWGDKIVTDADSGLVLIIIAVSALCAYACVPRDTFRTIKSRMRWGIFFLLAFLAIAAIRSWDKLWR